MPNWCSNSVTMRHADPAMIDRVVAAFTASRLMEEFIPVPLALKNTTEGHHADKDAQDLADILNEVNSEIYGYQSWYDFCVNEWGTKWDVGGDDLDRVDQNTVMLTFDSAWAPPVAAYNKMCEQGFEIEATYWEPGMAFVGRYVNGDDEYFEYGDQTADTVRQFIGEDLDDAYGISDTMSEWEDDQ